VQAYQKEYPKGEGNLKTDNGKKQSSSTQIKISPSEWNDKWKNLPKGQSMVGLDGKTYIKN
jgi:hypothetical protein